ncbi:MAG: NAD(P)H-dependent oxidoreductase [Gammaproteobacteria bacterium]|nr:NAD(P)H-dependent oxidoreductase [Gammaproteobacteria bacterium]
MEILAISGSVRKNSYNTALLNAIVKLSPSHINVTLCESIGDVPSFNPELSDADIPESVCTLISKIRESDGLIFSCPEYAHGVPGVFKNFLDWLVASDCIILKPVVVMTVSTSGLGGVRSFSSLVQILSAMNSNVVIDGSLCVPYAKLKFNENLDLVDQITMKAIDVSLLALARTVN